MSRDTEIIEKLKTEYRVTDDMREYKDPEKENEIYYQYSSDGKWIVEIKIQVIQYTEKLEGFILQLKNLEVLEILYGRDEEIQIDVKYSAFQNLKELLLSHHCNFSSELILKYKNLRSLSVSKTDTWDLFFQFLEKKQRSSLEFLNLTNANFSSLPVSVSKLKNLKSLDLSRCKELNSLPDWIGELSLLESLNLSSMSISMLPVSVSKLKNLKSLDLSGCSEPNSFPECIGELFQLESLNLSSMSISMLPVFVSKLKNLKSLNLSGCSELNSLPDWIGELSLLEYLDLSITNISTLPVSVSKLKNLKNLDFSSCSELNSLPECIGENFLLETLDLSDTKISTLPTSVSKLKNLKTLWLTSCEKLNSFLNV